MKKLIGISSREITKRVKCSWELMRPTHWQDAGIDTGTSKGLKTIWYKMAISDVALCEFFA